jgi:acyl dehydratase
MDDRASEAMAAATRGSNPPYEWCTGAARSIGAAEAGGFAAALGERDPELLSGSVLVPTIAIIPAWEAQECALARALPHEAMQHALHAEHGFEFLAPLEPERSVTARARIIGVSAKRRGTLVTILTELSDDRGLVGRQHYAVFAVGASLPAGVRPTSRSAAQSRQPTSDAPDQVGAAVEEIGAVVEEIGAVVEEIGAAVEQVDEQWAIRYAQASGDFFEVHLDRAYAQALGYPNTILHGMCTLGIAARDVRELLGRAPSDRLLHLGARFSAPVILPANLRTEVAVATKRGRASIGTFTTTDIQRGSEVLTRGYFAFGQH